MGNQELIDCFDTWGIKLTTQQLLKPSPEFVYDVYLACILQVNGVTQQVLDERLEVLLAAINEPNPVSLILILSTLPSANSHWRKGYLWK